jgi:hypothetical protein
MPRSAGTKRLIIDVAPELHAALAALAKTELRSMNAQAATLLREALERRRKQAAGRSE